MKIGGVAGAKHPTLKKGEAIPLSPEEKLKIQAKSELVKSSPEGYKYLPTKAEVLGDVQVVRGREGVKNPDPVQYLGSVLVTCRSLRLADERLFPEKRFTVKIHCKDCKDELGLEDLETVKFDMVS